MYLLDGHVHLQHQDRLVELLDCCSANMRQPRNREGAEAPLQGVLLMAALPGQGWPQALYGWAREGKLLPGRSQWRMSCSREQGSVVATSEQGDCLVCIIGEQVNTRERLELLLFGLQEPYQASGLADSIEQACAAGGLVILPWGVGKWLGARGRLIRHLLADKGHLSFFLGDNAGRPRFWQRVPQFVLARAQARAIIRGTDPLLLPGELERVGSFGTRVEAELDLEHPLAGLQRALGAGERPLNDYGELQGLGRFFRNQLLLRLPLS
ncbi:hypothetical protein [Desulfogranum mediterraneum]|uniref:hypothetical protein n=1 Tax=Desulfogranum mediterraneum TaxID=160661 RepID=UPI0012946C5C|nr:hypothetical protein [Desulfogranum mediterraneum]